MNKSHFFVVRHGESENNILEIESSKLENKDQFGLSENGKRETEIEAQKFKDIDIIITSPFRRAKETAIRFARTSQCDITENELLREVDVGDYELCKYEITESYFKEHGESVPFPNGESFADVRRRTIEFFEIANQIYNGKKILIVTHGWNVFCFLEHTDETFDGERYLNEYDGARKVVELKKQKT